MNGMPVLHAEGKCLPEAWENSISALVENGITMPTDYDRPGDVEGLDSTMIIVITEPRSQPRMHLEIPGDATYLGKYVKEVLHGTQDHLVPQGKIPYTYHRRLYQWGNCRDSQLIDQMEHVKNTLVSSFCSRRAQAVTWDPRQDAGSTEPPCLQSLFFRLVPGENDTMYLDLNARFRSNDAFRAALMNMFALITLQYRMCVEIQTALEKKGEPFMIHPGRYCHMVDSYHVYGSCMDDLKNRLLKSFRTRSFSERTMIV